jgi:hypothetical protein
MKDMERAGKNENISRKGRRARKGFIREKAVGFHAKVAKHAKDSWVGLLQIVRDSLNVAFEQIRFPSSSIFQIRGGIG